MKPDKGAVVFYRAFAGHRIRARIRTCHKDGSFTIEAMFALDDNGKDIPGYLGYKYRIAASKIEDHP